MTGLGAEGTGRQSLALKRSSDCMQIIVIEMVSVQLRGIQGSSQEKKDNIC